MRRQTHMTLITGATICAAASFALAETEIPTCEGDTNGDFAVDSEDLNAVLGDFGQSGEDLAGDVDGSGTVDSTDLNTVLGQFGTCAFDYGTQYGDPEAWQIGLEMLGEDGSLTLPSETFDRIDQDLDAIRESEPDLQDQIHSGAWISTELLVSIPTDMGTAPIDDINGFFQVVNVEKLFDIGDNTAWVVEFPNPLNMAALAGCYGEIEGVNYAETNGLIGGQNFWIPTVLGGGVWQWDIDDGFHDCFDGCDCHIFYVFETTPDGEAEKLSEVEEGLPWCEFDG